MYTQPPPTSPPELNTTNLEQLPLPLLLITNRLQVLYCNAAFEKMVNEDQQSLKRQGLLYFIPVNNHAAIRAKIEGVFAAPEKTDSFRTQLLSNEVVDLTEVSITLKVWPTPQATNICLCTFYDLSPIRREEREHVRLTTELQVAQSKAAIQLISQSMSDVVNRAIDRIENIALQAQDPRAQLRGVSSNLHEILAVCGETRLVLENLSTALKPAEGRRKININDLVPAVVKMIRCVSPSSVRLEMLIAPQPLLVSVDIPQLVTALTSLFLNAVESFGSSNQRPTLLPSDPTEPENLIHICVSETKIGSPNAELIGIAEGTYVAISVQDNGPGMNEETRLRINDIFYSTKPAESNIGIGINLAQACAIAHQGALEIKSNEGQGTTVTLLLSKSLTSPGKSQRSTPPPSERNQSGVTASTLSIPAVLFADDESQIRALGERYFKRLGFVVQLADDGQHAIELFSQSPHMFALVVLDVSMPRLSGIAALEEILRIKPQQKALLITGADTMPLPPSLLANQNVYVLQKPWGTTELEMIVKQLLK